MFAILVENMSSIVISLLVVLCGILYIKKCEAEKATADAEKKRHVAIKAEEDRIAAEKAAKEKAVQEKASKKWNMNETFNDKRYQFVLTLYRIRKQYPRMGLLQPDFIWVIFRAIMPSKYDRTNYDIKDAVNEWCDDPVVAAANFGHQQMEHITGYKYERAI